MSRNPVPPPLFAYRPERRAGIPRQPRNPQPGSKASGWKKTFGKGAIYLASQNLLDAARSNG